MALRHFANSREAHDQCEDMLDDLEEEEEEEEIHYVHTASKGL